MKKKKLQQLQLPLDIESVSPKLQDPEVNKPVVGFAPPTGGQIFTCSECGDKCFVLIAGMCEFCCTDFCNGQ